MYHAGAQTPPWPQTHHQSLQSIPLTRNGEGPCVVGTLDAVSSLCASYVNIREPSEIPTGWTILSPSKSPSMLTSHPQTWWDGNLGPGGQNGDAPQGPARPWSWTKAPQTMPGAPEKRNIIGGYHISNVGLPTPRPLPWTSPDMGPSSEPRCRAVGEVGGM